MASYHTDCHICGRKKWHDAIPGQVARSYCPTCEAPKKRTAHDDVPPKSQMLGKGRGMIEVVESKVRLPEKGIVGEMRIVSDESKVYCYINESVGWMDVGTADEAAVVVDAPAARVKKAKDKKNNRRAAIEATRRKQAERERASREE